MSGKITLLILLALVLGACQVEVPTNSSNTTINDTVNDTDEPVVVDRGEEVETESPEPSEPEKPEYAVIVTGVAGELISLEPEAIDPDGDALEYEYSAPFNEEGKWKTEKGDAGEYEVTVTAFDGVDRTTQEILVRVNAGNQPPTLSCPDVIRIKEGEVLRINCDAEDPEGQQVLVAYTGFIKISRYKTSFQDAGTHYVNVTAWDKSNPNDKVRERIKIIVEDVNLPPKVDLGFDSVITGYEGDVITVVPTVDDRDGDDHVIQYSEPFAPDGTWKTEMGDAGTYDSSLVVSDGENIVKKVFQVRILERNSAPVIMAKDDIYVDEGETVDLDLAVRDREDDEVSVDINGFMETETYTTTYNDGYPGGCDEKLCTATYTVTVTATDGKLESEHTINVHVKDKNRPPVFRVPA